MYGGCAAFFCPWYGPAPPTEICASRWIPCFRFFDIEQEKYEAKLAAEREALLKMAGSKKADEETRERAQKAKAEMQASWWCSMVLGGSAVGHWQGDAAVGAPCLRA